MAEREEVNSMNTRGSFWRTPTGNAMAKRPGGVKSGKEAAKEADKKNNPSPYKKAHQKRFGGKKS